ncbi:MAG: hypothetical protein M1825_000236 [Sarcosagium campestre]|nr:MAG: hypothetical protein M1825_000236 [Sarcosagium campestre]
MDAWSNEQLENMKRNGNIASNRTFNPLSTKPPIPLDVDEVDSAMERFIRQKYEQRLLQSGNVRLAATHNTGSTSSEEPPPLPPKPGNRFGVASRAASSVFPRPWSKSPTIYNSPPLSPDSPRDNGRPPSPSKRDNQSRVFGASVRVTGESFESKLAALHEMGFHEEGTNARVLKGVDGNLDTAVDVLVRLARNVTSPSRSRTPVYAPDASERQSLAPSRRGTPVQQNADSSKNPFEQSKMNPVQAPWPLDGNGVSGSSSSGFRNPFDRVMQQDSSQAQGFEQSFQRLQVSQQLFPHLTGGFPSQHQQHHVQYQQPLTPLVPSIPTHHNYFTTTPQQSPISPNGFNPFSPSMSPTNNMNPFPVASPPAPIAPQHYVNSFQQQSSQTINFQAAQPQMQHSQQPQPLLPQSTGRADKSSILALYNYPHLAPAPPTSTVNGAPHSQPESPLGPSVPKPAVRSFSTPVGPVAGSRNPFLGGAGPSAAANTPARPSHGAKHISQESVDVGGWQSGRLSPDAFASLSARYVR